MDYEKKYNEALEHARAEILANPGLRKTWEEIFPELAESEDERIRKALIMLVQESLLVHQGCCKCFHEFTEEQLLAWLEKQKEPSWKPSEHQMNILKAVKEYVGRGSGYWGEGLGSLIEDLEKLI